MGKYNKDIFKPIGGKYLICLKIGKSKVSQTLINYQKKIYLKFESKKRYNWIGKAIIINWTEWIIKIKMPKIFEKSLNNLKYSLYYKNSDIAWDKWNSIDNNQGNWFLY